MMKIKAVIIDDDPYIRNTLRGMLDLPETGVELLDDFEHPLEAIEFLKRAKPDLLFLDIQMPLMNGFELLDNLQTDELEVIFITSYNQYAVQAIRYSALDYLLKPINPTDLYAALDRYRIKTEKILTRERLNNLRHNLGQESEKKFQLVIPTKQGEFHFRIDEIVRCEADSNYTEIHLKSGKKFLASKTLGDVESMLEGEQFVRVHKSHLVNLDFVSKLTLNDDLEMLDGATVGVSRRRLPEVKLKLRH